MAEKHYSLGIDLGTSNSAMALAGEVDRSVRILDISQVHGPNSVEAKPGLPSAIYLPRENEFEAGAFELPRFGRRTKAHAEAEQRRVVGAFAREHGALSPDRLIISAKSWLCNSHVDRHSKLLPWGSKNIDESLRYSPVEASREYLELMRQSFLMELSRVSKEAEAVQIVITVPASFDEPARQLTQQAAAEAGFADVILMEEPQAAFYAWLEVMGSEWRERVRPGDIVLVCDVGGGTSDFSLIAVTAQHGDLSLDRVSVGAHILLGGDNVDLALAYALRAQMEAEGKSIDDWQFLALIHACRVGKEHLCEHLDHASVPVAVPSRGSSLVAGSVSTDLGRQLLDQILLDGFLPVSAVTDVPQEQAQVGLREHGLNYAHDPVLTKHLAQFLTRSHANVIAQSDLVARLPEGLMQDGYLRPTAVLFNGGFFKAEVCRNRILEILRSWCGDDVRELAGSDYALAVAKGASFYGLTKVTGKGVRIRAGASRSYYLGLETTMLAIPGFKPPVKAICVVPQGMEEGTEEVLEDNEFGLVTGEPVNFRFFSSPSRGGDAVGAIVSNAEATLEETAALQAEMEPLEGQNPGEAVPVKLHSRVTELGTLELWMQHTQSERRWKLEFSVRTE